MTAPLFDLGVRLRAEATGTIQPMLALTPYIDVGHLVAVTLTGETVTVHEAGKGPVSASGADGIGLLGPVYRQLMDAPADTPAWPTLVIDNDDTLDRLHRLALAVPHDNPNRQAGALIDWWSGRLDHPASNAVISTARACSTRWATGEHPDAERDLTTWAQWLNITAPGPTSLLLAFADIIRAGEPNPALDRFARPAHHAALQVASIAAKVANGDDSLAGKLVKAQERLEQLTAKGSDDDAAARRLIGDAAVGRDWATPDSPRRAAKGLESRERSVAVWERALIDDPIGHQRSRYTGKVVHGTALGLTVDGNVTRLEVVTSDPCRYRAGDRVKLAITQQNNNGDVHRVGGEVRELAVQQDGSVLLRIRPTANRVTTKATAAGDYVVIEPPFVNLAMSYRAEEMIDRNYGAAGWAIKSPTTEAVYRPRPVPLEVRVLEHAT